MYNPRLSKAPSSVRASRNRKGADMSEIDSDLSNLLGEIEIVEKKKKEALEDEDYATALELKNRLKTLNSNLLRIEYSYFGDLYSNFVTKWANDLSKVIAIHPFKDPATGTNRKKVNF